MHFLLSIPITSPSLDRSTLIGIIICISGNILISLALNIQKLAHLQLAAQKQKAKAQSIATDAHYLRGRTNPLDDIEERSERTRSHTDQNIDLEDEVAADNDTLSQQESRPLLPFPTVVSRSEPILRGYGAASTPEPPQSPKKRISFVAKVMNSRFSLGRKAGQEAATHVKSQRPTGLLSVDDEPIRHPNQGEIDKSTLGEGNESDYLKSKLWWTGFVLMNIGECGNFISYAWAPASIVAPLGTFALIANCFFAPLILNERFRMRDIFGIILSIIGAITVVLSSPSSEGDPRLNPRQLVAAISKTSFIVYTMIYVLGILILATLSNTPAGDRYVFIDVGVCAFFGGFTVLATKAVSSLLTMEWIRIFTEWITYPSVAVLLFTGIGQIRYLNRALMKFAAKVVIPIQFVLFNLSAIVGSSILYGDFENAKLHQIVTFLYGCTATFAGVFVITWSSASPRSEEIESPQDILGSPLSETNNPMDNIARRRERGTLVIPATGANFNHGLESRSTPILPKRHSAISLTALNSQAQVLLHTPPQDVPFIHRDIEHGTPGSASRRWTSWLGEDITTPSLSRRASLTRDYMGSIPRASGRRDQSNGRRSMTSYPQDAGADVSSSASYNSLSSAISDSR